MHPQWTLSASSGVTTKGQRATNPCWVSDFGIAGIASNNGLTVDLAGYGFNLGRGSGIYTVYSWVRDGAGNISSQEESKTILFQQADVPIIDVWVANTVSPADPPLDSELDAPASTPVHIKWRIRDNEGILGDGVSLAYTYDGRTNLPIAVRLQNGSNDGCIIDDAISTYDDEATGCFSWNMGPSLGEPFRVVVTATNTLGVTNRALSQPMNPQGFRWIGANTGVADRAHAVDTVFGGIHLDPNLARPGKLAVADDGTIYYIDEHRGLLRVRLEDGLQELFIPAGSITDDPRDGGSASLAVLRRPLKIALDNEDRLLIFDHDRIRRVDTTVDPPTIDLFIGGGGSSADDVPRTSVQIEALLHEPTIARMPFWALPNGDIYFRSESELVPSSGGRFRRYNAATDTVSSIVVSGIGHSNDPTADLSQYLIYGLNIAFNPQTSALTHMHAVVQSSESCGGSCWYIAALDPTTGVALTSHPPVPVSFFFATQGVQALDGSLVMVYRLGGKILRFNPAINVYAYETWAGTGTIGLCPDGIPRTACAVHPSDAFSDRTGRVWFLERDKIRTEDDENTLQTIAGGARRAGNGDTATSARVTEIDTFGVWDSADPKIVFVDRMRHELREFSIGGNVEHVAGDGRNDPPTAGSTALSEPLYLTISGSGWAGIATHPVNGAIYMNLGPEVNGYINRSTGTWVALVGNGAIPYITADGELGADIDLTIAPTNYPGVVLGYANDQFLASRANFNAGRKDSVMKLYNVSDGTQEHLLGTAGDVSTLLCPDGTLGSSCTMPFLADTETVGSGYRSATYDSAGSQWLVMAGSAKEVRTIAPGGTIGTLATLNFDALAYTYDSASQRIYYCAADGTLRQYNVGTSQDTLLATLPSGMLCDGKTMHYDATGQRLFLIYEELGLQGIAEYNLAP